MTDDEPELSLRPRAATALRDDGAARRLALYSTLRFASFVAAVIGLFLISSSDVLGWSLFGVGSIVFAVVFVRHNRLLERLELTRDRITVLEEEEQRRRTRRRSRTAPDAPPPDARPLSRGLRVYAPEPEHYELDRGAAEDIAVFSGPRNLFALLDVSSTRSGRQRLRYILSHPLRRPKDILERQNAVRALAGNEACRRGLLVGFLPLRKVPEADLAADLDAPRTFAHRNVLRVTAHIFGTLDPLLFILSTWIPAALPAAIVLLLVQLGLVVVHARESNLARNRLLAFGPVLDAMHRTEATLRRESLDAASWKEIGEVFTRFLPSLERVRACLRRLSVHELGLVGEAWNILTLWELRFLAAAERAIDTHRDDLEAALGALAETEAILGLASLANEAQDFSFPEPLDAPEPSIEGDGVAHPLLDPGTAISNPVTLRQGQNVLVVTGANMAGKSTYLKAIASNVLLASIGSPVCARSFRWTPVRVFTDINIRDSLDDGKSYFQVEVERVRTVIDESASDPRVLAVFDELFRGTNVEERIRITRAVLRHLRTTGILLVVATHDGKISRLVTHYGETGMRNAHFRETVSGTRMTFDYQLHDGPAPTHNAVRLIEANGYPAEIVREAREDAFGSEG
jgi:hypothetical protein